VARSSKINHTNFLLFTASATSIFTFSTTLFPILSNDRQAIQTYKMKLFAALPIVLAQEPACATMVLGNVQQDTLPALVNATASQP
jgi:hypothetical protein